MIEEKRTEPCAYFKLNLMDGICSEIGCNGLSQNCVHYVTTDHLKEFYKNYNLDSCDELRRRLENEDE